MVSTGQCLPNPQYSKERNPHFWLERQEYARPHGSPWSKEGARVVLGSQGVKTKGGDTWVLLSSSHCKSAFERLVVVS